MPTPDVKEKGAGEKQLQCGTVNAGYEYEELVPAYFALKLLMDENVQTFTMKINPRSYGKFDDLVITIKTSSIEEHFAIQLKHRIDGKNEVNAADEFFRKDSKNKEKGFNIASYLEVCNKLDLEKRNSHKYILFTNTIFKNFEQIRDYEICPSKKPFSSKLLNVEHIVQFEERKKHSPRKCNDNFFLIYGQENVNDIKQAIEQIFVEEFGAEPHMATSYINFFKDVHNDKYNDTTITRDITILNLARFLLCNCTITPPSSKQPNSNIEMIDEAIKMFDLVILPDINKSFISNYWKNIYCEEENIRIDEVARKTKFLQKSNSLNPKQRIQLLPYLTKRPLFVEFNEGNKIYRLSKLFKSLENYKIHLVLVGKQIETKKFNGWNIFGSLKDLAINKSLYDKITGVFNISLQGKESVSVSSVKDSLSLDELVTPSELFSFLKGVLIVGKPIDKLPQHYIPRKLVRKEITRDDVIHLATTSTIVIHCNDCSEDLYEYFRTKKTNMTVVNLTKNKDIDLQHKTPVVFLTDELKIQDNHKQFYHFTSEQNTLKWMDNKVDPKEPSIFENDKSLAYGESGIGKTTMVAYLTHNCPLNYWVVSVPLNQQISFFKKEIPTDQIIKQYLTPSENSKFSARVIKERLQNKQVIFFFDGLNELSGEFMEKALNIINDIANKGFKVWVFCTTDVKSMAQNHLSIVHCYEIEDMMQQDQQNYICKRLKDANVDESIISHVTNKLFEGGVTKNNDIFKLPIVLYILTEILSTCKDVKKLDELLVLDKIYASFLEGKLQHNLNKINCNHLDQFSVFIDAFRDYYTNGYKSAALQICFEPELFKSLHLQMDKSFFNYIKANGDYLKIIRINRDYNFLFNHYTYAEYFAALWLSENLDALPNDIKECIIKPKYEGIRRFFDAKLAKNCPLHLAIIEQDLSKVKQLTDKHLNDKDKAGRNPLHLAVTYGVKHPIISLEEIENKSYNPRKNEEQEDILKFLIEKVPAEMLETRDGFLQWNSFQYADAASCLFSLEQLSEKKEMCWDYLKTYHQHPMSLSYYCVKMGYKKLLKVAIDKMNLSCLEARHQKRPLLHLAIEYNQTEIVKLLTDHGSDLTKLDHMKQTPLQEAVLWGHTELVKLLLQKAVNINAKGNLGRTALHLAAKRGHKEIVQILLENEAEIDCIDDDMKTPLHIAARKGETKIVDCLVKKGANVNAEASDKSTSLHQAAEMGHLKTAEILVECGANIKALNRSKKTPLIYAAQEGHVDMVNYLITKGADVFAVNDYGGSARHEAELKGHTEVAKILKAVEERTARISPHCDKSEVQMVVDKGDLESLKHLISSGGNIEETDGNKETLLHIAAFRGHLEIVKYLLIENANYMARNIDNRVPLHLACQNGHIDVVVELLRQDEHFGVVDRWKLTPLHRAAIEGRKEVVEFLVNSGADINARSIEGDTPLHSAAVGGHIDVMDYLISHQADLKAKNNKSKNCLHVATQRGCTDAVEYLLKQSKELLFDIDYRGRTALHFAVEKGYKSMVQLLIRNGSDVNKEDFYKQTALDIAVNEKREEIIKLLNNNKVDNVEN